MVKSWRVIKDGSVAPAMALEGVGCITDVAMFDELDEGTAIFKCTNDPPRGADFLTFDGLPTDHYLWLTGRGGKMLRGEVDETMPKRSAD
jgi:hypothetical protein